MGCENSADYASASEAMLMKGKSTFELVKTSYWGGMRCISTFELASASEAMLMSSLKVLLRAKRC